MSIYVHSFYKGKRQKRQKKLALDQIYSFLLKVVQSTDLQRADLIKNE